MQNWEELFLGRTNELATLHEAWALTQQGKPQISVLLGETGLGKTRIVQQFYADIAKQQTSLKNAYWPPTLSVGRNLSMQPELANPSADMPWLWWSMRFLEQEGRNLVETVSPFEAEDKDLAANAEPILRRRRVKHSKIKLATTLSTIIADIASVGIYGNAIATCEMISEYRVMKAHAEKAHNELMVARVKDLVDKTLSTLRLFLDKTINDAPSVPVVLVIDDAQWIDPVSLQALFLIFGEAVKNNWPLMVLATHWEKEWNQTDTEVDNYDFRAFKQFYEHCKTEHAYRGAQHHAFSCITLNKMQEEHLAEMAIIALPGVAAEIRKKIVTEADGNPRAMEEMLRLLLQQPSRYFINGEPDNELSQRGLKRVAQLQKTELYEKIKQRFDELDNDIQEILTASSLFGVGFQRPIVLDLIEACDDIRAVDKNNGWPLLKDAESIHALLQTVSDNGHAFQQKVYRSVAFDYLKDDMEDTYDELCEVINPVLEAWLVEDKLKTLTAAEQLQLCEFAVMDLINRNGEVEGVDLRARAIAFEALVSLLNREYNEDTKVAQWWALLVNQRIKILQSFFKQLCHSVNHLDLAIIYNGVETTEVVDLAVAIAQSLENDKTRPLANYLYWVNCAACLLSEHTKRHDEAYAFFNTAVSNSKNLVSEASTEEQRDAYVVILLGFSDFLISHQGDTVKAKLLLEESLAIRRQLIQRYGETPERLRNITLPIFRLGLIYFDHEGDITGAKILFEESLSIARQLIENHGETPQRLRDITVSIYQLGRIAIDSSGDVISAKTFFEEILSINRQLIEKYGETPERLRDITVPILKLASITLDHQGDIAGAKVLFKEGLLIARQLIERFGETPDRLADITVPIDHLGLIALEHEGDVDNANALFEEFLSISRHLIDKYGETLERLRATSVAVERLGDIALDYYSNIDKAKTLFEESMFIRRSLVECYGETPDRLADITVPIQRLGRIALEYEGDVVNAKVLFEESLTMRRQLVEKYGETPQRLRDITLAILPLGVIALESEGEVSRAKLLFEECLSIRRRIIDSYGETPERLRDITLPIDRLARIALEHEGDVVNAKALFEESLAIARQLIERYGETPDRLRDITVFIERLGDVALVHEGEIANAKALFGELLSLRRQLIEKHGETPERLRNITLPLDRLARIALDYEGEVKKAKTLFEECLAIGRQLIESYGETPDRLRDITVPIDCLASIALEHENDVAHAKVLFEEALSIRRQLTNRFGETPDRFNDILVSIDCLGFIALEHEGNVENAKALFEESLSIIRELIDKYGETIERKKRLDELLKVMDTFE